MYVLAHISDPHLAPMPRPRPAELASKRLLGFANWRWRRRHEHRPEVLEAVVRDMAAQSPDHVAVTGDLVNIALPGEFAAGRDFLEHIGPPDRVTFVPGNHDAYVRAAGALAGRHWGPYMAGDRPEGGLAPRFPFVRRRGPLALIGLSTALPTGPFMAWGRLGPDQLHGLDGVLERLAGERLFRAVLLHHPPLPFPGDRHKRLLDANEFLNVVRRRGAELVLHGHSHLGSLGWTEGPGGGAPVVGVPSASAGGREDEPAAYNLFRIEAAGDAWRCEWVLRGIAGESIQERRREVLWPRPAQ